MYTGFFLKIMLQRRQVSKIEGESRSVYRVFWGVYMARLGVYRAFFKELYYSADQSLIFIAQPSQISSAGIVCCSVLQCVAVCCSVLQCVAVCCSVLQCVAVCRSVLWGVAVCCSVLQCVAM